MELTNALRREVKDLSLAKARKETGLFRVEGEKCVAEALQAFPVRYLFTTFQNLPRYAAIDIDTKIQCTSKDLERMTGMKTAPDVIGVFEQPDIQAVPCDNIQGLILALDAIQDPGNLGTIIRVCDWMGVETVLAGVGTADVFSPKVVQAAMGAIARVNVIYCPLAEILASYNGPVYGTFLGGENIYEACELSQNAIIIMGNEGNGISEELEKFISCRLTIPSFPPGRSTSESLNVATATAITLSMFRRNATLRQ